MPASLLAVSVGGLVVLTIGAYMKRVENRLRPRNIPRGFSSPVVAMQMARSMREVELIIGEPGHDARLRMRRLQLVDCLFACAYWLEFITIGYLMWQRGFPLAKPLGAIAMLSGTLTALFDVRKNLAILKILPMPAVPEYDRLVQAVNAAATRKWWFFSITMILIVFAFASLPSQGWKITVPWSAYSYFWRVSRSSRQA